MSDDRRIIYAITDGEYSDYHVVSIWEKKDDAIKVAQALKLDPDSIEEWPLNESKDIEWRLFTVYYKPERDTYTEDGGITDLREHGAVAISGPWHKRPGWHHVSVVTSRGRDVARKIGLDLIGQYRAREAGVA